MLTALIFLALTFLPCALNARLMALDRYMSYQ
jgi:hypothetical protein